MHDNICPINPIYVQVIYRQTYLEHFKRLCKKISDKLSILINLKNQYANYSQTSNCFLQYNM